MTIDVHLHGRLADLLPAPGPLALEVLTPLEALMACCAVLPGFREAISEGEWRLSSGGEDVGGDELSARFGSRRELHMHPAAAGGIWPFVLVALVAATATAAYFYFQPPDMGDYGDAEDPDRRASFFFRGAANATAQGGPVPLIFGGPIRVGSVLVSASLVSERVTGRGGLVDDDDDDDDDDDEVTGEGGVRRAAEQARPPTVAENSLQTRATLRAVDLIGEGEMEGLVDGLKSVYVDDTPVQAADGSMNIDGVSVEWRPGTADQDPLESLPATERVARNVNVKVTRARPVVQRVYAPADAARVTLRFPGLTRVTDKGDRLAASVRFEIHVAPSGGEFTRVHAQTITDKNVSPAELSWRVPLDGAGSWRVRVSRLTPDSDDENLRNDLYFARVSSIIEVRQSYPHSALVGITADAERFPSGNAHKREYEVRGLIVSVPDNYDPETREYNGIWTGAFKRAWTDCGPWCALHVIESKRFGLGGDLSDEQLSALKWPLYEAARWADEMVDDGKGGSEPRFAFTGVVNSRSSAKKLLDGMFGAFRAALYHGASGVAAAHDEPSDPVALVGEANVIDGEFAYGESVARADRVSAVAVTYHDAAEGRSAIELVVEDDLVAQYGWRQADKAAMFCTSRGQAHRLGRHLLYAQEHESATLRYAAGIDQAHVRPGDVIRQTDRRRTGERAAMRVVSAAARDRSRSSAPDALSRGTGNALWSVIETGGGIPDEDGGRDLFRRGATGRVAAGDEPAYVRLEGDRLIVGAQAAAGLSLFLLIEGDAVREMSTTVTPGGLSAIGGIVDEQMRVLIEIEGSTANGVLYKHVANNREVFPDQVHGTQVNSLAAGSDEYFLPPTDEHPLGREPLSGVLMYASQIAIFASSPDMNLSNNGFPRNAGLFVLTKHGGFTTLVPPTRHSNIGLGYARWSLLQEEEYGLVNLVAGDRVLLVAGGASSNPTYDANILESRPSVAADLPAGLAARLAEPGARFAIAVAAPGSARAATPVLETMATTSRPLLRSLLEIGPDATDGDDEYVGYQSGPGGTGSLLGGDEPATVAVDDAPGTEVRIAAPTELPAGSQALFAALADGTLSEFPAAATPGGYAATASEAVATALRTEGARVLLAVGPAGSARLARNLALTVDAPLDGIDWAADARASVVMPDGGIREAPVVRADGSELELPVEPDVLPLPGAMLVLSEVEHRARLWRVVSVAERDAIEREFSCIAHDPRRYAAVERNLNLDEPDFGDLTSPLPAPDSVTLTASDYDGRTRESDLSIDAAGGTDPRTTLVEYQLRRTDAAGDEYRTVITDHSRHVEVPRVRFGVWQARARFVAGVRALRSPWTESAAVTVDVPGVDAPTGLEAEATPDGYVATWDSVDDPDYAVTEVRDAAATVPIGDFPGSAALRTRATTSSFLRLGAGDAELRVGVRHVDRLGNASAFADVTVTPLSPLEGHDGAGWEHIYAVTGGDAPSDPNDTWGYEQPAAPWHDGAPEMTAQNHTLWRAKRKVLGAPAAGTAVDDEWSDPVIVGRFARDGAGWEYIYAVTDGDAPSDPIDTWRYKRPAAPWHDNPPELTLDNHTLWRAERRVIGTPAENARPPSTGWSDWSDPKIVGRYGADGNDAAGTEALFAVTAGNKPAKPARNRNYDVSDSTWHDGAPNLTAQNHTLWRTFRRVIGVPARNTPPPSTGWSDWSDPKIVGRHGPKGDKGNKGDRGEAAISVDGAGVVVLNAGTIRASHALSWRQDNLVLARINITVTAQRGRLDFSAPAAPGVTATYDPASATDGFDDGLRTATYTFRGVSSAIRAYYVSPGDGGGGDKTP